MDSPNPGKSWLSWALVVVVKLLSLTCWDKDWGYPLVPNLMENSGATTKQ